MKVTRRQREEDLVRMGRRGRTGCERRVSISSSLGTGLVAIERGDTGRGHVEQASSTYPP